MKPGDLVKRTGNSIEAKAINSAMEHMRKLWMLAEEAEE